MSKDIVTVMGGVHPTLFPAHVLGNGSVDYCIRGEGETPFFELVAALSRGREGRPCEHRRGLFQNGGRFTYRRRMPRRRSTCCRRDIWWRRTATG